MQTGDYFDDAGACRQRLIWAIATRRQLDRWEPFVARDVGAEFKWCAKLTPREYWEAASEHHLTVVAARNLVRALDLPPSSGIQVEDAFRAEIIEGRDLLEHWDENMPVFMPTPQGQPSRRSGKVFAARHPRRDSYFYLGWGNETGAMLLPGISAPALHELLDQVEAYVLAERPDFVSFIPAREPSAWLYTEGEWWPKVGLDPPS